MGTGQVDFLIAGVQKSGTTALHALLSESESLSMATTKEVHFFDDDSGVDWEMPDYSRYHAFFDPFKASMRGEATPIYIYWPHCLNRIKRYRESIKFILLFRDPTERAWSHWRMERARGFDSADFQWAIRDGRRRVEDDLQQPGYHRIFSYVERGFYGCQVEKIMTLFPRDQMLFLKSDDLSLHCDATLERVCDFLNIPKIKPDLQHIRHNVSPDQSSMRAEDIEYLKELYKEDTLLFTSLTGISF